MKKFLKDDELGYTKGLLLIVNVILVITVFSFVSIFLLIAFNLFGAELNFEKNQNLFAGLFQSLFMIIILHFIRKILITVKNKNPFCPGNVKRLRALGFTFIGMEILVVIIMAIVTYYDLKMFTEVSKLFAGNMGYIMGGVLLVISEVFRLGIKLKNENELTI